MSDTSSLLSYGSSSSSAAQNARPRPPPLRLDHAGIDPTSIVGKTLTHIQRSKNGHPTLILDFSDKSRYQVLVDGYDPTHPGVPKELELDPLFEQMLAEDRGPLNLRVTDCTLIKLSDKAFQRDSAASKPSHWNQPHLGVAFKFEEKTPRWRCVWAMMEEYQDALLTFRSFEDVYLQLSPRKLRSPRKQPRPQESPTKQSFNKSAVWPAI